MREDMFERPGLGSGLDPARSVEGHLMSPTECLEEGPDPGAWLEMLEQMERSDRKQEALVAEALGGDLEDPGLIPKVPRPENRLPKTVQFKKLRTERGLTPPFIQAFPENPGLFGVNELGPAFLEGPIEALEKPRAVPMLEQGG
jgi:hypothetical protein